MKNKKRNQNLPYRRILFIDREISSGVYPSAPKMAEKYGGVSVLTIKRDIDYMRTMLDAPIEYDKAKKGYFYTNKTFMLPLLFRDEDDLFAGYLAAKLLTQYKATPIYKKVKDIFDSFKILISKDKKNAKFENRVLFIEETAPDFANDIWNKIMTAIRENRYVDFSYKGGWVDYVGHGYHIAPYQMVCKAGCWYFAGYSQTQDCVSLYALHRIISIDISDEIFKMPDDYQYLNPNEKNLGIFSYDKKVKCVVQFFNESANYVTERKLFDDQKTKRLDDKSVIITFSSGQIYEVLRFVLSQGANAVPLKPKGLVDSWQDNVLDMHKNIKK